MRDARYFGRTTVECDLDGVSANLSHYPAGTPLPMHRHEQAYFCIVLQGRLSEEHPRGCDDLRAGAVVFHPAHEAHANRFAGDGGVCLNLVYPPEWAADRPLPDGRAVWSRSHAATIGVRLTSVLRAPDGAAEAGALAAEIWSALFPRRADRGRAPWLDRIRERVDHDPAGLTIASLAAAVPVHPAHLARAFRLAFGVSLGAYLRRARLARCYELLASSREGLSAVALDSGFADQSHMSNAIRGATGLTPRRLRRFFLD